MRKLGVFTLWAAAMFAGRQRAGATRELGHVLVSISLAGYGTHHYRADVNGQNPRVSAQWMNKLAAVLP